MTNVLTITGNLTGDPELRRTPSGQAVTNFTIADTPRTKNPQTNEWVDGETLFMRCAVWREAAENVAESLAKGMRVTATGKLKARSYETKEGDKRTAIELDIEEIGPALKYATAKVTRKANDTQNGGGGHQSGGNWGGQQGQQQSPGWGEQPASSGGWGEQPASSGGWGEQPASSGGWGTGGTPF